MRKISVLLSGALACAFWFNSISWAQSTVGPRAPGTIQGNVFNDLNGNGRKDAGEPGIAGVTVRLAETNGTVLRTTTTNASGDYAFSNVDPRNYLVKETDPAGFVSTTANTVAITVSSGKTVTVNFGDQAASMITGTVYEDLNGNGIQDLNESGLNAVMVLLYSSAGTLLQTTFTDATGLYGFVGVSAGSYIVQEQNPVGFVSTTSDNVLVSVSSGGSANASFGDIPGSTVSGNVYNDLNGDGVQEAGEPGIANVTVELLDSVGTVFMTTTTDLEGRFSFTTVPPGPFFVRETDPPGFTSTTANLVTITVAVGGSATANFGDQETGSVSGAVFNDLNGNGMLDPDEPGLGGVTVDLTNPSTGAIISTTTTADDGLYSFQHVTPGSYIVRETDPSGYVSTSNNAVAVNLIAGGAAAANFGDQQQGLVTGTMYSDLNGDGHQDAVEPGVGGATIRLLTPTGIVLATTETAGDGTYIFTSIAPGSYVVEAVDPAGFVSTTPDEVLIELGSGGSATANFGERAVGTVSGQVFNDLNGNGALDLNEPGLGGVTVQLTDPTGTVLLQVATTSGDGSYVFTEVLPGSYLVKAILPSEYFATSPVDAPIVVTALTSTTANFGAQLAGTVSGTVFNDLNGDGHPDANEPGLSGITVQLTDPSGTVLQSTTTVNNGTYLFTGVAPGSYLVKEIHLPNYISTTPDEVAISLGSGGSDTVNFGDQPLGTISGSVFNDLNGNGIQDLAETGIGGVLITLANAETGANLQTTVTAGDGTFLFPGLPNGTYLVKETDPAGYASTTANTLYINLSSGGSAHATFGDQRLGSISGVVFTDLNGDGRQDPGETGIAGVTVELITLTGMLVESTTTIGNGSFALNNVVPGSYRLIAHPLSGFVATTPEDVIVTVTTEGSDSVNYGQRPDGSVSGIVYNDLNGNHRIDSGEPGMGGITVQLVGPVTLSTITDGSGSFFFPSVPAGTYHVIETPPSGFAATTPTDVVIIVPAGGSGSATFGNQLQATINGYVYNDWDGDALQEIADEAGIPNVVVQLLNARTRAIIAETTTTENGLFFFSGVAPGSYIVNQVVPAEYVPVTQNPVTVTLNTGGTEGVTFADQPVGAISGTVYNDLNGSGTRQPGEPGIGGVLVQLKSTTGAVLASTLTASDGAYIFPSLSPGIYIVQVEIVPGFVPTGTGPIATLTLNPGAAANANFGEELGGSVSGVVFNDLNRNGIRDPGEPGLRGFVLQLFSEAGTLIASTVSQSDGSYQFPVQPPGSYIVQVIVTSPFIPTTPTRVTVSLTQGSSSLVNFGEFNPLFPPGPGPNPNPGPGPFPGPGPGPGKGDGKGGKKG